MLSALCLEAMKCVCKLFRLHSPFFFLDDFFWCSFLSHSWLRWDFQPLHVYPPYINFAAFFFVCCFYIFSCLVSCSLSRPILDLHFNTPSLPFLFWLLVFFWLLVSINVNIVLKDVTEWFLFAFVLLLVCSSASFRFNATRVRRELRSLWEI